MRKTKIHIILNQPYPVGMACTNRIQLYARGLLKQGNEVKIILPIPLEHPDQVINISRKGCFEKVKYEHAWHTSTRSKSFLHRRWHDFLSPLYAALITLRDHPDSILLVSTSAYHILLFKIVTTIRGICFFKESSELPFFEHEQLNFWQRFYVNSIFRLFNGVIVISNTLYDYLKPRISSNGYLLKIPILVDVNQVYLEEVACEKTIVYTGPLTQQKDGILTIIKSFFSIAESFPDYVLELTGNLSSSPVREAIHELINNSGSQQKVRFLGFIDREELLEVLNRATVLLLAKPFNRQSTACFPTKLGEYLATGNPVLTTNVGEISNFLEDGITAFLSEPTVKDFAARLHDILSDLSTARLVGARGQALARQKFDYSVQVKPLSSFLALNSSMDH
jgi:glycosyltransferase involved in cell wall biosynthesis